MQSFEREQVRGWLHEPAAPASKSLVITHGAGSNCNSPLLVAVAETFADSGFHVLRCDLPYRQERPTGPPLHSAERDRDGLRRAVEAMREIVAGPVILGGHSYGGRQATILAAENPNVADTLLLLAYPLHPPRKPEQLRTQHFAQLRTPALFLHGTRDPFGTIAEMEAALALIPARHQLFTLDKTGHEWKAEAAPAILTRGIVLRERLNQVEERILRAAGRSGRQRSEIALIAVTKKFGPQVILEAYELGLRDFGENYVQEFEAKHPAVAHLAGAKFHLIGHLQSNKTRVAAKLFQSIHTLDSEKLARRLNDSLEVSQPPLDVMIEVKLSPEESKVGAAPEALPALVDSIRACPRLNLTGLMTMPPWSEDQEQTRPYFRRLAALAQAEGLPHLSMGMSHDFEAAIEEGATHIRVGTALFGPRPKLESKTA